MRHLLVLSLFISCSSNSLENPRRFDHVVLIVLENQNYSDTLKNSVFKNFMQQGAILSDFYALTHPSYHNYLAMVSGDLLETGLPVAQITTEVPSIADLLEAKGLTWKNYAEGYPGNCFLGDTHGKYARKHVPFLSFKSIQQDPARCARVVSGDQFMKDWHSGELPNYAFYSPDLDNDGHDTGLNYAGFWLDNFLSPLLADIAKIQKTLFIITFDESHPDNPGENQIYTVFIGPMVRSGASVSTTYNHYSVLRTIEQNFSLGTLGKNDETADAIEGIWVR